ncbi:MAG: guanylate kinase [Clostridia bacterium]|nr:guanylate kinase [Clostridia bacterium]
MNRSFRLSTALDVDDLLLECVPYAIRLANEKYKFNPPLTIHEVDRWGRTGTRADIIFEFMDSPEFISSQPPIKGAQEFVKKLSQMTEIFISTAIWPEYMSQRFQRIVELFPEIPRDHILMGSRKDKIDVDILFDDGMHNILKSNATYPVLMRRPWNREATGIMAVNNYDEFLKLVEVIANSYSAKQEQLSFKKPGIVVLVGPSGSGKNEIAKELLNQTNAFDKLISYTTNKEAKGYHYVTEEQFRQMNDSGEFFEATTYANHSYGSRKEDVEQILNSGQHVITVMDICGAMALKTLFPHVITVYVKRYKKDLITAILEKNCTTEDKTNRLLSIENESRNAQVCDYTVMFENGIQAVKEIRDKLHV